MAIIIGVIGASGSGVTTLVAAIEASGQFVSYDVVVVGLSQVVYPALRADQPSPTGDDNDGVLSLRPFPKPRPLSGTTVQGWKPKLGEDPRNEVE